MKSSIIALATLIASTITTLASADQKVVIMEPITIEVKMPTKRSTKVWVCTEEVLQTDANTVRFCRWVTK